MTDPLPDWDFDALVSRQPAAIQPVPAGQHGQLRGRRVLIGLPGLGWRGDLRADAPVVQGSRTHVPVLTEHDWYRAEAEQIEVFAPLVPIERVWVEVVAPHPPPSGHDVVSRLVSLDAPPVRHPVPLRDLPGVTGRRVVWVAGPGGTAGPERPGQGSTAGPQRRDLRAVTEPYSNAAGDICVRVATELDWYRWAWSGQSPRTLEVPVHLLWAE